MRQEKQRTNRQNRAMWKMFEQLAEQLNDSGLEMKEILKYGVDVPWSKSTVCELIWRPVMTAQIGKKSTTEMTTKDIDLVFETITRHLASRFGIAIEFPSVESLSIKELVKEV